ncbi:MAG: acetate/propionate family kinase [Thermoproteota archaeon]
MRGLPGKILVVNCGSSSIKYKLFDADSLKGISSGLLERIGSRPAVLRHEVGGASAKREVDVSNHRQGLELILRVLLEAEPKAIRSLEEIVAVGHRVVHGGDAFFESTLVDEKVLEALRKWSHLAPLHNPPNIAGIEAARSLLPRVPQVAVFDTAFHQTMPETAYLYAIPFELYEKLGIRRYGFHGTSHKYVAQKAAEILGVPIEKLRIITCHLGNGCSITAVKNGRSIDTSMGFTPLEGLVMGTRSGDIDPSIVFYLIGEGFSPREVEDMLNKKSGLLGVSGVSNDIRDVEREAEAGSKRARLALEIFAYRAKKYIGAYAAVLGGLDVLVFTGGIGENDPLMRRMICGNMGFLGLEIDEEANRATVGKTGVISGKQSRIRILVIPTDEELAIAEETRKRLLNH